MTDFVGLCRAVRELPGPDTHDRLWAAWFALPAWHFVSAPSPVGPLPFSNFINGQRCVLAFTTASGADHHARQLHVGPPMALAPDAAIQRLPQLKMYGVSGFLVDPGPDGFHTSLDNLWAMFHRFRAAPPPAPPAPAPPAPMAGPPPRTPEWYLALPAWHVVMTTADRTMPELASNGSDLVAQIYSSQQAVARFTTAQTPIAVMPPAKALQLLTEMELVKFVQLDRELVVDLVDLSLR